MSEGASTRRPGGMDAGIPKPHDLPATLGVSTPRPEASRAVGTGAAGLGLVAALVLCSGACGLIYQTAWLRELRLVFGISTPATAATLAIFMAGLGAGSLWLGARVDRVTNPLFFYGVLELGIAASAALSPALLALVRIAYFALGGQASLGLVGSTLVRLALAACVIGVPAILMGGTLPAVARAVTAAGDQGRRRLARVYAINTLGAVGGVVLATFVLIERLGAHLTVWLAAAVNLGDRLAVLAMMLRPLGLMGFGGGVLAWSVIAGIVVLPAALVAGFQFPLLVRLLGEGRTDIGSHTGRAYAWNTAGAIAGSLAGGFGLLPWLTAPGVWYLATWLLAALSVWTVVASARSQRSGVLRAIAVVATLGAILLVVVAQGPTAFWRHGRIGPGRASALTGMNPHNQL